MICHAKSFELGSQLRRPPSKLCDDLGGLDGRIEGEEETRAAGQGTWHPDHLPIEIRVRLTGSSWKSADTSQTFRAIGSDAPRREGIPFIGFRKRLTDMQPAATVLKASYGQVNTGHQKITASQIAGLFLLTSPDGLSLVPYFPPFRNSRPTGHEPA